MRAETVFLIDKLARNHSLEKREYLTLLENAGGEEYAYALARAGAEVVLHRMPDALHGYFSLPSRFPLVRRTYSILCQFLNGEQS